MRCGPKHGWPEGCHHGECCENKCCLCELFLLKYILTSILILRNWGIIIEIDDNEIDSGVEAFISLYIGKLLYSTSVWWCLGSCCPARGVVGWRQWGYNKESAIMRPKVRRYNHLATQTVQDTCGNSGGFYGHMWLSVPKSMESSRNMKWAYNVA